jgi:hypothetical protein
MSPIGNFFRKTTRSVGNFFNKGIARPVDKFFKKGVPNQIIRGISSGLGTVGNIASGIATNPLVIAGLTATAPELLPAIPALAFGGQLAKTGSKLTNYKAPPKNNINSNPMLNQTQQHPMLPHPVDTSVVEESNPLEIKRRSQYNKNQESMNFY